MNRFKETVTNLGKLQKLGLEEKMKEVSVNLSELTDELKESQALASFKLIRTCLIKNKSTKFEQFEACSEVWCRVYGFSLRNVRNASIVIKRSGGIIPYALQTYRYDDFTHHGFSRKGQIELLHDNFSGEDLRGKESSHQDVM